MYFQTQVWRGTRRRRRARRTRRTWRTWSGRRRRRGWRGEQWTDSSNSNFSFRYQYITKYSVEENKEQHQLWKNCLDVTKALHKKRYILCLFFVVVCSVRLRIAVVVVRTTADILDALAERWVKCNTTWSISPAFKDFSSVRLNPFMYLSRSHHLHLGNNGKDNEN